MRRKKSIKEIINERKIENNPIAFKKFIDNDYRSLIIHINSFMSKKQPSIIPYILENKYISYKHEKTGLNSVANIEYSKNKNKLELPLYWNKHSENSKEKLKNAKQELKALGISYNEKNKGEEKSFGALLLRPYINNKEDFEAIKPLIIQSINNFL